MKATDERSFGALLRRHRHAAGLTQEELAERANLSVQAISALERGLYHRPRAYTVRCLGHALGLSEDERAAFLASRQQGTRNSGFAVRASLPVPPTAFIGREREVAAVVDLLRYENVRLLTLTGPGGSGKTRLAIEAGRDLIDAFSDGVVFVPLASIADPALVASTLAAAVGVMESGARPAVEALERALREKRLLLVLDNFEHLRPAATLVSELLAACENLVVLVTSRAVLRLAAEHTYAVPPLALPEAGHLPSPGILVEYDAVALFVERARAANASFSLTGENAAALVDICRRLDGLPLAIELAAARSRLFPPHALLERLESRLQILTGGARDLPARQQTLRSAIDWSYSLLSDEEQTLFRRLSVFVGGWTLEGAEAVCGEAGDLPGRVVAGLESLLDQSLLVAEEQAPGGYPEPRFRMLETVREYALEQLAASRETEQLRRRHAEVFLRLAEDAEHEGTATGRAAWPLRLAKENDNLRAALSWSLEGEGSGEIALRLAGALVWFWIRERQLSEGRRRLEQSLAISTSSHAAEWYPRARAKVVTGIANLARRQGDFATARIYAEEGVAIWRMLDDNRGLTTALVALQWVMRRQGDHLEARSLLDELLVLSRDEGDVASIIVSLNRLASAEAQQGNLSAARAGLEEALALSRQTGHTLEVLYALFGLAEVAWAQGDTAAQRRYYDEMLAGVRSLKDPREVLNVLGTMYWLALRLGEYDRATDLLTGRLALVRGEGTIPEDWWGTAWTLNHLGDVARCKGDERRATSLYEESLSLFRQHEERQGIAAVLHNLGHVALSQGDTAHARSLFMESLSLFRELDFTWSIADAVMGLAGVAGQEGHPQQAALLYGAAEAAHAAIDASGMLSDPANAPAWEREKAASRGEIDEKAWEQVWTTGRTLSIDQALAHVEDAGGY